MLPFRGLRLSSAFYFKAISPLSLTAISSPACLSTTLPLYDLLRAVPSSRSVTNVKRRERKAKRLALLRTLFPRGNYVGPLQLYNPFDNTDPNAPTDSSTK